MPKKNSDTADFAKNYWTNKSIQFAQQANYLDELFRVYPINPDIERELDPDIWKEVEKNFKNRRDKELLRSLLKLKLFPTKDSYVAFLRHDESAIERNPKTVARICGRIYQIGLAEVRKRCEAPKETNRQMGQAFRYWVQRGFCRLPLLSAEKFEKTQGDAIFDAPDAELKRWCAEKLGYVREKGLDFVARVKGKYIIGEAKFLTDFGGHQSAQLADALATMKSKTSGNVQKIVIADGVCYLPRNDKICRQVRSAEGVVLSALFLPDFLHSL